MKRFKILISKKIYILGLILIILSLNVSMGCKLISYKDYKKEVGKLSIEDINFQNVKDGEYKGKCNMGWVEAVVLVEVKSNKINNIKLLWYRHGRGKKAKVMPERVIQAQSLKVDTITGATNGSKIILKAIENALKKGIK